MVCVIPRTGEGSSAQDIGEADGAVEERANGEHRAFGYTVAIACILEMLRYGFGADSENFGDFPISFTPRNQRDAFDLTLGKLRRGRDRSDRGARYLAGGFECETADKLDERQLLFIEFPRCAWQRNRNRSPRRGRAQGS